jgi:hypothetical protein
VKLRCCLESLLRIHRPDCELCNPRESWGREIRKRLEELNSRTQPHSLNNVEREEAMRVFDCKPGEVVPSPPILLAQQKKSEGEASATTV